MNHETFLFSIALSLSFVILFRSIFLYVNNFFHWFYLLPCVHFLYYFVLLSFRLPLAYFQLLHTLIDKMDYNSFFAFTFHSHQQGVIYLN